MPVAKITETLVAKAEPGAYWDTELKGFGLIVRPTGRRTLVVQKSGRRRWTLGHHPALRVADARRSAVEIISGKADVVDRRLTLARALEMHLGRMEARGNRSMRLVEDEVQRHLGDWLRRPMVEITRADCERRHRELKARGPQLAERVMRHLRAVWNSAHKKVDLPTNPTVAIDWAPLKRRDYPRIDLADWHASLGDLSRVRRDWHLLAISTGLRKSDACSVRWSEVDLEAATLHRPNPKGGRAFTLPLSEQTRDLLAALPRVDEWVFPSASRSGHIEVPERRGHPGPHHLRAEYMAIATDLGVPSYPKKLLVNHSVPRIDITDGYVANPDVEICRPWQQRISDRVWVAAGVKCSLLQ